MVSAKMLVLYVHKLLAPITLMVIVFLLTSFAVISTLQTVAA